MQHRAHNRLSRWHRRSIYALTGLLLLSGLAWLVVVYLLALPGEATPAPHPLAGPLLATHGITAYVALIACALVGHAHLRAGWKVRALHAGGLGLVTAFLVLVVTGLGFYYLASEAATPWLRWSHVVAGIGLPWVLARHIVRGRTIRGRTGRDAPDATPDTCAAVPSPLSGIRGAWPPDCIARRPAAGQAPPELRD